MVGPCPYPEIFGKAGKACQGKISKLFYKKLLITAVKVFITLAPGANVIKQYHAKLPW
jgi:hypothetical protein